MFKVIRKQFLPCSAQKLGSYVVMHSLHQLCFCLQPYSRVSSTFKPKFKLWDFSRLRFSSKKRSARYIVFCKKCWIWNIRSTRQGKRRETRCDILAFLISFSCNSIQSLALSAIMKVVYVTLWSEIDGKLHTLSKLIGGATYPDESD